MTSINPQADQADVESHNPRSGLETRMSIFKSQSTPRELAEVLFMWALYSEDIPERVKTLAEEFQASFPVEHSTLYREYVYFRMFITDWVLDSGKDQKGREQVRENFFLLLVLMAKKQPNSAEVLKEIKERLEAYTAAANTDHHLGASFMAATTFCELCGDRGPTKDISLISSMVLEFSAIMKTVDSTLRKVRIA
jgi:hypothetical protein